MANVYVLLARYDYEGTNLLGAASSLSAAKRIGSQARETYRSRGHRVGTFGWKRLLPNTWELAVGGSGPDVLVIERVKLES